MSEIDRRRMLGWLAAAAGVLVAAPGLACSSDDPEAAPTTTSEPGGEALLAAVQRVGDAYLAAHPDEADAEVLAAALPADVDAEGDPLRLMRAVEDAAAADYAAGRVVLVDGWRLAQTGARAAALVSLST
jgi:hypothetical protein